MKIPVKFSPRNASIFRTVFALAFCLALWLITDVRLYNWYAAEEAEMERTGYWGVTGAVILGSFVFYPVFSILTGLICGAHFKRLAFFPVLIPLFIILGTPAALGDLAYALFYAGLCLVAMLISRAICKGLRYNDRSEAYIDFLFIYLAVFVILLGFLCYYAATDHPRRWALTAFLIACFFGLLGWLSPAWEKSLQIHSLAPPAVVLLMAALAQPQNWFTLLASAAACWLGMKLRAKLAPPPARPSADGRP